MRLGCESRQLVSKIDSVPYYLSGQTQGETPAKMGHVGGQVDTGNVLEKGGHSEKYILSVL